MAGRRTTLGPLPSNRQSMGSSGGMKSRASMGMAGRVSGAPKKTRHSMAPSVSRRSGGISRRSSMYAGGVARKADPRPVGSKEFMQDSIQRLITYLMENEYPDRISPKILHSPTGRDFGKIVTFLFQAIDSSFELTTRVEEVVPAVYKALKYPFSISKTALTAVGSPHTWPALLACLTWMIELLEYDAATAAADAEKAEGDEAEFFFSYLQEAYTRFLAADDEAVAALDGQVSDNFGEKFEAVEVELVDMAAGNDALRARLAELKKAQSPMPALQARLADYDSDIAKFKELIQQLTSRHEAAMAKEAERRVELEAAQAERDDLTAELARVQSAVEGQELSQADVEALRAKKARLRDARAAAEAARAGVQEDIYTAEGELSAALTALESAVGTYHDKASALGLLAPNDHNAGGVDFELRVAESSLAGSGDADLSMSGSFGPSSARATGGVPGLLGADIKNALLPALRGLKSSLVERMHADRSTHLSLRDAVEEAREAAEEWARAKTVLTRRVAGLEETLAAEKSAAGESMDTLAEDMAHLDSMLAEARQFRDSMAKLAAEVSPAALDRTRREVDRAIASMAAEKEAVVATVMDTAQALVQHKQLLRSRLQHVQGIWARKHAEVAGGSVSVPSTSAVPSSPAASSPPAAPTSAVRAPVTPQQAVSAVRRASLRSAKRTPIGTPALGSPPPAFD